VARGVEPTIMGGNMKKGRVSTEIIDGILRSLGASGTTKTRIMYASYISYSELKTYLNILLAKGFIRKERETGLYKITPDGSDFLESIDQIRGMVGEPRKQAYAYPAVRDIK
jgi:predicted transcriptional regulator